MRVLLPVLAAAVAAAAAPAAPAATMRAVTAAAPGCAAPGFECVNLSQLAVPSAGPGQVLIKVAGSGCSVTDTVEAGPAPWFPLSPGRALGYTVSGTVQRVGPGVSRLAVGDRVWTMLGDVRMGAWAEFAVADAEGVSKLGPGLPLVPVGALVDPVLVDWWGLVLSGAPWPAARNATVVIVAGSGGTGFVAVQLAKAMGARTVITAAHGAETISWLKALGASVVVDYHQSSALEQAADDSVDFVFDNHSVNGTADLAMQKLRAGGAFMSITSKKLAAHPKPGVRQRYFGAPSAVGVLSRGAALPDFLAGNESRKREALDGAAKLLERGRLKPYVQASYSLEQAREALAVVAAGHVQSKIAISVG